MGVNVATMDISSSIPRLLATSVIILVADLALLVAGIPRLWALAATLSITLLGVPVLAAAAGRQARRCQGSTRPRRIA